MSKITKKTTADKEPKIVESEVVKTPPSAAVDIKTEPAKSSAGGNTALKIFIGCCLGCLVVIILVVVGTIATGGLFLKNIALPFAKKFGQEVETGGSLQKLLPTIAAGSSFNETDKLPANFPNDFPIDFKAKLIKGVEAETFGKKGFLVTLETSDPVSTAFDYYRNSLPIAGYTVEKTFGDSKAEFITIKKDTLTGLITISKKEDSSVTLINIVLGEK